MPAHAVGIREVARRAGVHASTVSLALRGSPLVKPATREHVACTARELGYRSLPGVRQLMQQLRTARKPGLRAELAMLHCDADKVPVAGNPIAESIVRSALQEAARLGYRLERFTVGKGGLTQPRLQQVLDARGIHGCLVYPGQFVPESGGLNWQRLSWVRIGYAMQPPFFQEIVSNHLQLVRLALEHAVAARARRIGLLVNGRFDRVTRGAYVAGFLDWQHRRAPAVALPPVMLPEEAAPAVAALKAALRRLRPDLLIVPNAAVFAPLLKRAGARVPADVRLVSLHVAAGDTEVAGTDQRDELLGAMAVRQLDVALTHFRTGVEAEHAVTLVDGVWRAGASLPLPA